MDVRFQPMTNRPPVREGHKYYRKAGFSARTPMDDLERELSHLQATDIVIESGHERTQIRNDGWPRGSSSPSHPDVRLFFKCKHGTLRYECNEFSTWEHNLRAIGLWMQRQRLAIEEWGIGSGGEAYRGFAQLPSGIPTAEWSNVEAAAEFLLKIAGETELAPDLVIENPDNIRNAVYRDAAKRAHPDTGGSVELMSKVNRARDFIDKHRDLL